MISDMWSIMYISTEDVILGMRQHHRLKIKTNYYIPAYEMYLGMFVFSNHMPLNSAYWVILHALFFLSPADFSSKSFFSKKIRNTISVSNSLDQDQANHFFRILVQTVYKSYQQTALVGRVD